MSVSQTTAIGKREPIWNFTSRGFNNIAISSDFSQYIIRKKDRVADPCGFITNNSLNTLFRQILLDFLMMETFDILLTYGVS